MFRKLGTVTLGKGVLNALERDYLLTNDGEFFRRDRVTHPGAAVVVPVDDVGVWMLRQYRAPVDEWVWELPAGLIDPGEVPEETAVRECVEEVGQRAGTLTHLGRLVTSPGILQEHIHVFLASDLAPVDRQPDDHEERLAEVRRFTASELSELAANGELINAIAIAALTMAGYAPRVWPGVL